MGIHSTDVRRDDPNHRHPLKPNKILVIPILEEKTQNVKIEMEFVSVPVEPATLVNRHTVDLSVPLTRTVQLTRLVGIRSVEIHVQEPVVSMQSVEFSIINHDASMSYVLNL